MPKNQLGNFIRERRMDLGLTQEQLAERLGGGATQAEVSRLERGRIALPRRERLSGLAAALHVTIGELLLQAGWLAANEVQVFDGIPTTPPAPASNSETVLGDLHELREMLLAIVDRISMLETAIQNAPVAATRPEVDVPIGMFDDWERARIFVY